VDLPGTGPSVDIPTVTPDSTPPGTSPSATPSPSALEALATGNTQFALDLHGQLADEPPETNVVTAPYSISTALAMTYAGARGETATETAETLHLTLPREQLPPTAGTLDDRITDVQARAETATPHEHNDVPFRLSIVNQLWCQSGYRFNDAFLRTLATHYDAGLRVLDFQADPDRSRRRINRWVAGRTESRITELLPEGSVDELTRLVLTNAVYFLSNWASTFDEESTERREFTALDGTTTDVQTMFQSHRYPYAEVDGTQVVELPYENPDYGMVVVLPPWGSFRDFEGSLDAERLTELFDALSERLGALYLPRFTRSAGVTLNRPLADLGMDRAFDRDRAEFTGVVEGAERPDLWLTGVYHETFIEVAEWGTEAAAATGAVGGGSSAPTDPFEMHIDHPFLYCIRHRPTGSVLFLGRVVDASPMR
jgi:serpin B